MQDKVKKSQIGYIGECYTIYKLALLGVQSTKLPPCHDYDILTFNDTRIEVKSAKLTTRKKKFHHKRGYSYTYSDAWQFANHRIVATHKNGYIKHHYFKRKRQCDYFVFVCFNKTGHKILTSYIVPIASIPNSKSIVIGHNRGNKYDTFEGRWNLITGNVMDCHNNSQASLITPVV